MDAKIPAGNKARLLDAALELFSARGYEGVGVAEIAGCAGVTKPTLYHYFGNKKGLFDALLHSRMQGFVDTLERAAAYDGDLPRTLFLVASAHARFSKEEPSFYRLLLALWLAPPASEARQAVARWHHAQHAIIERLFVQAAEDHGNMRGRHQRYAASFQGLIHTYVGLSLHGLADLDDPQIFSAVHQFMHGIFS